MSLLQLIQRLARGYEVGYTGRIRDITRTEMLNALREVCDREGLSYSQADLNIRRHDGPRQAVTIRSKVTHAKKTAPLYAAVARLLAEPDGPVARRQDRAPRPGKTQTKS